MKNSLKIALVALGVTCFIYVGCKKTDLQPVNQPAKTQGDQNAMASKIANDFLKAFSSPSGKSSLKTNASGLSVMSTAQCGDFTITPIDKFFMRGDTSVSLKGKSIFTFTCSEGNEKSAYGPDGYTFADTLYTTESGKGFANNFEDFQKYKAISIPNTTSYSIVGNTHAFGRFAIVGEKGITEYHDFSTKYELNGGGTMAMKDSPATLTGKVDFRCVQTNIYPSSPDKNSSFTYAGFMDIQKDVILSYFFVEGERAYMKYELDPVTKKIISGPTKVDFDSVK
jgi:hypothetical protein